MGRSEHLRREMRPYQDRVEAGQQLAEKLMTYANRADVVVLALPRGGVPVALKWRRRSMRLSMCSWCVV
jgi:predicted phosphoribosyltransferase